MSSPTLAESPPGRGGVCAVVVTYNPDAGTLRPVLDAALAEASALTVIDNGSSESSLAEIREAIAGARSAAPSGRRVTERFFSENRGLPIAFNEAIAISRDAGDRFLLLLDHDSVLLPGAVAGLVAAYDRLAPSVPVGALEAFNEEPFVLSTDDFLDAYYRRRGLSAGPELTDDFLATNSGLFFPVELPAKVGGFDESFFLDSVDFEFGLRIRTAGYRVLRLRTARIRHRRGEPVLDAKGRRGWGVRKVRPFRHYYVARDVLRTWRRYGRRYPLVGLLLATMPLRELMLVLLFYDHRRPHLHYLALGTMHALEGIHGRLGEPPTAAA